MAGPGQGTTRLGEPRAPTPWRRRVARALAALGRRIWYGSAKLGAQQGATGGGGMADAQAAVNEGAIAAVEFPDTRFGRFDRRYTTFTKWLSYLAGLALLSVVVVCVVDVIGWKLFGKSVPSATDFIQYMNEALVFLAVAYVQTDRGSTSIELLQAHYPPRLKVAVRAFSYFLGFACCMFVAYRGWYMLEKLWTTHDVAAGTWKFPLWPFEASLVAGIFFMGWGFVTTGIRDLINFKHRRGPYAPAAKKPKAEAVPPDAPAASE